MISAASAQIEARGGESLQIPNPKFGQPGAPATIPDYATVSAILLGVVCAYLITVTVFGMEFRGAEFEKAPIAIIEGAGRVDGKEITPAAKLHNDLEHGTHGDQHGSNSPSGTSIEHVGDKAYDDDAEKKA